MLTFEHFKIQWLWIQKSVSELFWENLWFLFRITFASGIKNSWHILLWDIVWRLRRVFILSRDLVNILTSSPFWPRHHFDLVTLDVTIIFCQHFENQSKGCKTVFENEPFQCSTESIRTKREKKRKGKKKKSQKNQLDLVINQGISTSGFYFRSLTIGHQLPVSIFF